MGEEDAGELASREPDTLDIKKLETGRGPTRITRPSGSRTLAQVLAEVEGHGDIASS
jgi:hypothetical protein